MNPQHVSPDLFNKTLKEMLMTRRTILRDDSSEDSASHDSEKDVRKISPSDNKPKQQIISQSAESAVKPKSKKEIQQEQKEAKRQQKLLAKQTKAEKSSRK